MHAEKCPVCGGKGKVPDLYSSGYEATCHGCQGKGWVEITDAWDHVKPETSKCPWPVTYWETTGGRQREVFVGPVR